VIGSEGEMEERRPVLEMRGISKRFPGVVANENVDLRLYPGEVLALLGENGAGKSTLMNILYGLYAQDEGEVLLHGRPVAVDSPADAIARGIGMVHQHFMLVPVMTVAENMIIGDEETHPGGVLAMGRARAKVRDISERYGLRVDPDARVRSLPVGVRQRVEILKALYRQADILILDEPSAVLTPEEADALFATMKTLTQMGKSIIFITHKLGEVMRTADRICILRGGRAVAETTPGETSEQELAALMVGREVSLRVDKAPAKPQAPVLEVRELTVRGDRGLPAVRDLSLDVRAGEIVGVAAVQGNGQTELVEAITGLRTPLAGDIRLDGRDLTGASPRTFYDHGLAHVPEDRHAHAMVDAFPVADNLILNTYTKAPFSRRLVLKPKAILEHARRLIAAFDIRPPIPQVSGGDLSGGNQQKMVVSREFSRPVRLLVAAQPTRGVDVGSMEFIHSLIVRKRDEGAAVLLVSTELEEILTLSDRILVMYHGAVVARYRAEQATRERLGLWMCGGTAEGCESESQDGVES
jgi:simple sugar transport system ATP-binding protein